MPIRNIRKAPSRASIEEDEDEIVFKNMINQANKGSNDLVSDMIKEMNSNKLLKYFITIDHNYPKDQATSIALKIADTFEITDKSQIPPPPKQLKESKDKTKIIDDVKEMIKNTKSKKKKNNSSDINVTQEYDKLLSDLDQLQKTKQKRKMIDEVTTMLEMLKSKKTSSKKSKVINDILKMLSDIPKIKRHK
jgi:hypothetical protein